MEQIPKITSQFGLQSATRLHEAGIASNRESECRGEYVPGPCDIYIYEDVLHGVENGKAAGCKVIAVYDEDSKDHWEIIKNTADDVIDIQQREES